jgi:hypothetical protein
LLNKLDEEYAKEDSPDRELLDSIWRILIVGWSLFCRTTEENLDMVTLILKLSLHPLHT